MSDIFAQPDDGATPLTEEEKQNLKLAYIANRGELNAAEQANIARAAYRDFGKGSGHPAGLNFGDCFAYALANATGEALLFKGKDFGFTDIRAHA